MESKIKEGRRRERKKGGTNGKREEGRMVKESMGEGEWKGRDKVEERRWRANEKRGRSE